MGILCACVNLTHLRSRKLVLIGIRCFAIVTTSSRETYLSLKETRDMGGAKRDVWNTLDISEQAPERVTTDGHDTYPQ